MKNSPAIQDLRSKKGRNLIRGAIANANPAEIVRLLMKVQGTCSEEDFKAALEVIRGNKIFKGNPIGSDFNKTFPKLLSTDVNYLPEDVMAKVNRHQVKISGLMELMTCAIEALAVRELSTALQYCREIVAAEGVSICLLKLLCFIRNHAANTIDSDEKIIALVREVDELLIDLKTENVRYLWLAIRELSSEKTDYFNISEKINGLEDGTIGAIARSLLDHIPRSEAIFQETLGSYYRISLFDAHLYLCNVSRLELPFVPNINKTLQEKFEKLGCIEIDPATYYDLTYDNVGLSLFRETFLLLELDLFFKYRTIHSSLFNSVEGKEDRRIPLERALLSHYFQDVKKVSSIGSDCKSFDVSMKKYVRDRACHFQNSTALIYALERNDGGIGSEEVAFVRLMSWTRDIGVICPIQYIENIRLHSVSDELRIVATCLSHIKQKSQLKEHELRRVIQEIAINKFDASLTQLFGCIYEISPAVTEHLIQTSDENFLSKLFQIIKNPNAAIVERANVLEWYGNKIGDTSYLERAKNLRIDVQINKEKGTIDDSRIYVEPVKYTQWINDQILNNLTILLESLSSQSETNVVMNLQWDKVSTGITVHDQIGSLLLRCYEEFCSNKIYGIASYLGRRIRHGTLKGTGLNDVSNFARDQKFQRLFLSRDFDTAYQAWVKEYEDALDQLRDRYLHIQEKGKPDGMILKDFRSLNKRTAANHMLHDVIKSFGTNQSGVELPYIILEYCWRIIEEDLSNIRKSMMEKKAKYAVFRFESSCDVSLKQRELQGFCQELHALTAEKFRTISSWFNKPSIASPSTELTLLFRAVVSEIKGFFTFYSPQIYVEEQNYTISGGAYFVIYDALYILIYNAAKYGGSNGPLKMLINMTKFADKASINITIVSEIADGENISDVQQSIQNALEGDCEDALVIEGRSGIKKLRRMEQDNYIGSVRYEYLDNMIYASFGFHVDYQS